MNKVKPLDAFVIHQRMLTGTGIWPKENPTIFYKIKTFFSWSFSLAMLAMLAFKTAYDYNDFTKISQIFYIFASFLAYVAKIGVFNYHGKTFLSLLDFLQSPIFTSHSEDLNRYLEKSIKWITIITSFYQYSTVLFLILFLLYPIIDHKALPFPLPYDFGNYTPLMFALQYIGLAISSVNNIMTDTLCVALMSVAAAQLDILAGKIMQFRQYDDTETISEENSFRKDEESVEYLKGCVKHHLAIIKYVETIEGIFTFGILIQFGASAISFCNTLFFFVLIPISSEFAMLANYFVVTIVQLFMYCWYGNKIMLKSLQIGDACYMSNWNLCNNKVRKYLFIIMERSKRPLTITTLKLSTLSLGAFLAIVRWSYSLLTLLLKMYSKRSRD